MEQKGRKNAAGDWLRGELISRIAVVGMILMGYAGFAVGFAVRGIPAFEGPAGSLASLIVMAAVVLTIVGFWLYLRWTDATWLRGLRAEQQIGDLIEHALAGPGCAFAHDVKEALSGSGNVDHVVTTPAGIWVVETKSGWLSKRRFPQALRQVAENVRRVRSHLDTSLPVRGALVIADRWDRTLDTNHEWNGEAVRALGPKAFWRLLQRERNSDEVTGGSPDITRVERMVWGLGSTRHLAN